MAVGTLAAAAALFLGFVGWPGQGPGPGGTMVVDSGEREPGAEALRFSIDVEPGHVALYSLDDGIVMYDGDSAGDEFDEYLTFLNCAEVFPELLASAEIQGSGLGGTLAQ
jgi:hypothetical protein